MIHCMGNRTSLAVKSIVQLLRIGTLLGKRFTGVVDICLQKSRADQDIPWDMSYETFDVYWVSFLHMFEYTVN